MPFLRRPEVMYPERGVEWARTRCERRTKPRGERLINMGVRRYLLITIMLGVGSHPHLWAQQMTNVAPAGVSGLPDDPGQVAYPLAAVVPVSPGTETVVILSEGPQTYQGGIYTLDTKVDITWGDRRVQADHIVYDSNTGEVTATGHVHVTGGANDEDIVASHGTLNVRTETGRFFDVMGSVGIQLRRSKQPAAAQNGVPGGNPTINTKQVYTNDNPFIFTGRMVVKTGPEEYDIYDGTLTSCQLPKPDWRLFAAHFVIDGDMAKARNSTFRLMNVPLVFLPYVTHPRDADARESGFLIPTIGQSSTKGLVLGEQVYVVLGRSADLTVGAEYYSSIGFAQMATFRYRGADADFLTAHYSGVLDRRPASENQGGEEVVLAARHDFSSATRVATNVDYLSSYVYREAFSDSYNQAVTSDIVSTVYGTHHGDGIELGALVDRYQGIKVVASNEQVRIFHAPTLSFFTTDHRLGTTGLEFSMESTASGLKRTQPGFETGGVVERYDLHPEVQYPIQLGGWHLLPTLATRETIYSRSRGAPRPGAAVNQSSEDLNRADLEFTFGIRPPVIERTFEPTHLRRLLGSEFRHTIEPEVTYRLTNGVEGFSHILRFDPTDVVSNTNELEYGVTQRIYRKPRKATVETGGKLCDTEAVEQQPGFSSQADAESDTGNPFVVAPPPGGCADEEFISWRLTQKTFFDQLFGGAVVDGRRNIFTTTLDLSGVAFLTEPRAISPLISRLRVRSSAHTDFEWDFDFDTGAKKFNSSNVYLDLHQGNAFGAFSYARLDAPGRFFTEDPNPPAGTTTTTGVTSSISDFNQLRLLGGYGNPVKKGLSIAGNAGIDLKAVYGATQQNSNGTTTTVHPNLLQYASIQTAYNWDCCGLTVEYRKFELGSVRNEGTYRFNFTLANIGAAGNLRRAERLF